MLFSSVTAVLAVASLAAAHPHANPHTHATRTALPNGWVQRNDHPAYNLFRRTHEKRQATSAAPSPSPSIGSPEWAAQYPPGAPDVNQLPKAWTDALNAATQAGLIPNVPQTTESGGNSPTYPDGVNRNDPSVCANTDFVCRLPDAIYDAPEGIVAIGFDDGPTGASPPLYTYLQQQNQKATHFMIGSNILANWQTFLTAYQTLGDDIAVHTWTHPYMTTQSNEQLLGELGWTMQIIHDMTGGKLPAYWRPPYGDIDTRVDAIAQHVFGMTAIVWNQDTEDWSIGEQGGATHDSVNANMQKWLTGPKSPGLIILEHELSSDTVGAFMDNYPLMKQNGWQTISTTQVNSSMSTWQGPEADPGFSFLASASTTSTSSSASASFTPKTNSTSTSSSAKSSSTSGTKNGAVGVVAKPASVVLALGSALLFALL